MPRQFGGVGRSDVLRVSRDCQPAAYLLRRMRGSNGNTGHTVGNSGDNFVVHSAQLVGKLINRDCSLALLTNNDDLITHLDTATQGRDIHQTLIHTDLPHLWTVSYPRP